MQSTLKKIVLNRKRERNSLRIYIYFSEILSKYLCIYIHRSIRINKICKLWFLVQILDSHQPKKTYCLLLNFFVVNPWSVPVTSSTTATSWTFHNYGFTRSFVNFMYDTLHYCSLRFIKNLMDLIHILGEARETTNFKIISWFVFKWMITRLSYKFLKHTVVFIKVLI